jgi:hypothetical protein
MRKAIILGWLLAAGTLAALPAALDAAGLTSATGWQATQQAPGTRVQQVRNFHRGPGHWRVRAWHHRPHYGNIVAGIALGTIIAAAAANAAPPPPSPDLCWYWTNPRHTHGYWDYCG